MKRTCTSSNTIILLLMLLFAATHLYAEIKTVTIRNDVPREDITGSIVDAHDGCLEFFNGRYYLYGTRYGDANGFTKANRYVCYSSDDLVRWHNHGQILKDPPEGVYYRPYVKYNEKTKKYVLWYNWYPKLWKANMVWLSPIFPRDHLKFITAMSMSVMPDPATIVSLLMRITRVI